MEIKEISKFIKVTLRNKNGTALTSALININEISHIDEQRLEQGGSFPCIYMKDGTEFYVKGTLNDLEDQILKNVRVFVSSDNTPILR